MITRKRVAFTLRLFRWKYGRPYAAFWRACNRSNFPPRA